MRRWRVRWGSGEGHAVGCVSGATTVASDVGSGDGYGAEGYSGQGTSSSGSEGDDGCGGEIGEERLGRWHRWRQQQNIRWWLS